ncbi:hypothetical protein HMPREF3218_0201034 [Prevotella bivia]|nr:hypothetical protein HMPREF3218_0201034 [Prevotella bivia]
MRRCFTAFYADSKAILRFCTAHFLLRYSLAKAVKGTRWRN